MSDNIERMLGKIDGKLDSLISGFEKHEKDDVRRFTEVYGKLNEHDKDIASAKGATKIVAWLLGGGALSVAGLVYALASGKLGTH